MIDHLVRVGLVILVVVGIILGVDVVTSWATSGTSGCRVTHLVTAGTLDVLPAALCGMSSAPTGCTIWLPFAAKTINMTFLTAFLACF